MNMVHGGTLHFIFSCCSLQVLVLGRHTHLLELQISPGPGTWRWTHLLELIFLQVLVDRGGLTYLHCFFSRYWCMEVDRLTWTVFSPGTGTWRWTDLLELSFLQVLVHGGGPSLTWIDFSPGTGIWRQTAELPRRTWRTRADRKSSIRWNRRRNPESVNTNKYWYYTW